MHDRAVQAADRLEFDVLGELERMYPAAVSPLMKKHKGMFEKLDKLEKEAKEWNEEHNSSAELEEARSANLQEYNEQVGKFVTSLTSTVKKAGMLARAGEAGLDICKGLQNGTEAEKQKYQKLETLVGTLQKIDTIMQAFKVE
jgi:hypothetical protein